MRVRLTLNGLRLNEDGDPAVMVLFDYWYDVTVQRPEFWDAWSARPLLIVLHRSWETRTPSEVADCRERVRRHLSRHPGHRLVYAAAGRQDLEVFTREGIEAIICSNNAFVDENLFRPVEGAKAGDAREFDALYDARFEPYKRHYLAAKVKRLALIHYDVPKYRKLLWNLRVRWWLRHAEILNRHRRLVIPRWLSRPEVAAVNRRARTGLCLSAVEGAMLASIQYLLSGLPVVTTPSRGGRDAFFDEDNSLTVEPEAGAVAAGVREMISRRLDPWAIRARAIGRMEEHRAHLRELVHAFQAEHGVPPERRLKHDWGRQASGVFLPLK